MATLLRMLRALVLLLLVLTGVAMHTATRNAVARYDRMVDACSRYAERRSATPMASQHPMVRRYDAFCGFGREP